MAERYAPWRMSDAPRVRSKREETIRSRDEAWGRLSFGFAETAPGCPRSIILDAKRPG